MEHKIDNIELMKGSYHNGDTLSFECDGYGHSVTGEFYIDNYGYLHHTHIVDDDEVEIICKYSSMSIMNMERKFQQYEGDYEEYCKDTYDTFEDYLRDAIECEPRSLNYLFDFDRDEELSMSDLDDDEKKELDEFITYCIERYEYLHEDDDEE